MYASKQAPVPDHRDQRGRHRRIGDQLPGVRRPVAAGRVGLRRPRRGDDRVLALAHQPLRHRDLLDRHPAPRSAARPGLRRAQPARRRLPAGRFSGGRPASPTPRSGCSTRRDPSGDWPSRRPSPSPGRRSSPRSPTWTSGPTTASSKPSTEAPSRPGCPLGSSTTTRSSVPTATRLWTPPTVAEELPVLIVPGLLVADDAMLIWLRDYAAAGGHLVIGPRTAYGDEEGRARIEVKPAHLADAAGGALPGVLQPRRSGAGDRRERRLQAVRRGRRPPTGSTG